MEETGLDRHRTEREGKKERIRKGDDMQKLVTPTFVTSLAKILFT